MNSKITVSAQVGQKNIRQLKHDVKEAMLNVDDSCSNARFYLTVCEKVKRNGKDLISVPISYYLDGYEEHDGGYLHVYGWTEGE